MEFNSVLFDDAYQNFTNKCKTDIQNKLNDYYEEKKSISKFIKSISYIISNKQKKEMLSSIDMKIMSDTLQEQLRYGKVIDRIIDKYEDILSMIH